MNVRTHTVMAGNDTFAGRGWDDFVLYALIDEDTGEVLDVSLSRSPGWPTDSRLSTNEPGGSQ